MKIVLLLGDRTAPKNKHRQFIDAKILY